MVMRNLLPDNNEYCIKHVGDSLIVALKKESITEKINISSDGKEEKIEITKKNFKIRDIHSRQITTFMVLFRKVFM